MTLQHQFENIVRSSLNTLSSNDLKPIALGLWHQNYSPNLFGMSSIELRRAGYLLDFFASFNCVSDARQFELMALIREAKEQLPDLHSPTFSSLKNGDPIAQEWHLDENISSAIQPLLKFQTRHYSLSEAASSP